jgi:hypothetical protein
LQPGEFRVCTICKQSLPLSEFSPSPVNRGGYRPFCKSCRRATWNAVSPEEKEARKAKMRARYASMSSVSKEQLLVQRRAEYHAAPTRHRDKAREWQRANKTRRREKDKAWWAANKEYAKVKTKEHRRRLREELLAAYGGCCTCCGEARFEFLAIDHINGDGARERSRNGGLVGERMARWLRANGYPRDRYQLLCHNCNFAKGKDRTCPHVLERRRLDASHTFIEDEYTA